MSCLTVPAGADPPERKGITIMTNQVGNVGGIDSHKETVHVAVIDRVGHHIDDREFPTTAAGYRRATVWLIGHGPLQAVGVEGTSSYGVGITTALTQVGIRVVEVNRTRPAERRRQGKTDRLDAYRHDRRSRCRRYHAGAAEPAAASSNSPKRSAPAAAHAFSRHGQQPRLVAIKGVGPVIAAQLLITAGDNPDRLRSSASFAALCGTSPIPVSSGRTDRHRLSRGGDRQANAALHHIVKVRLTYDQATRDHRTTHLDKGWTTNAVFKALKRAIAHAVFRALVGRCHMPDYSDLKPARRAKNLTLTARSNPRRMARHNLPTRARPTSR